MHTAPRRMLETSAQSGTVNMIKFRTSTTLTLIFTLHVSPNYHQRFILVIAYTSRRIIKYPFCLCAIIQNWVVLVSVITSSIVVRQ
ncbi:hypothetical protein L2E82_46410 [Cichorium intybus]|uniref:Uncharacterized protein n=1 Tax=Cichorium intybus TaxID=13427 RepID=A0ACB8YSF2_CICIN|nr:hypothetical protein L2E82_46410 [Cichorium intybus]